MSDKEINNTTTAIEKSPTKGSDVDDAATAKEDNECVVCFKNVDIYSIGECDHPVCYECSTRMRVLCCQNECPICRRFLSKVIFTYDKLPYLELEAKNRSWYYSKKHKISFYTAEIERAFHQLLDHPCPRCDVPSYRTLQGLRNHVRKAHDLHYCDLCCDNLKIFTFERRCYTQAELGLHRTKGDSDNRSHRGHPLCEYCNKRYLDRDDLFRHLRRDHYFCHFCDADGFNEFYRDYDALVAHFRQDHFLCEEGRCATEQFVGAFRTEIDYKAHVASVHGSTLNKQQAKQTRTLQLEITLGPRGRSGGAAGGHLEPGGANLRSRATGGGVVDEEYDAALEAAYNAAQQHHQRALTIDACNEQDFPSLGGASGNGTNLSLTRAPPPSLRNRSAIAGLARTKENFPALGSGGGDRQTALTDHRSAAPPISSVVRKPGSATGAIPRSSGNGNAGSTTTTVIHVSNRPQSQHNGVIGGSKKTASDTLDFPALPSSKPIKQQQQLKSNRASLEQDMLLPAAPVQASYLASVSAKHRGLVDPYLATESYNHQKLQMVQKDDVEAASRKSTTQPANAPKLTSQDFPSLGGSGNVKTTPTWLKAGAEKKQREAENRKAKVAPPPLLTPPTPAKENRTKGAATTNAHSKDKKGKEKKPNGGDSNNKSNTNGNQTYKEKNNNKNNNENKTLNANVLASANSTKSPTPPPSLINGNHVTPVSSVRPPPGFNAVASSLGSGANPPPGFHSNVTLNSVAKSPNNLTFTSSLGESYSIIPTHTYTQPPDATKRNRKLFGHFKNTLQTDEALEEFRHISQKFREGVYKPHAYYEHCQAALKDQFDQIFPELLALLPDISKQQALHLVHTQQLNASGLTAQQRKQLPKLEVCNLCKQVLTADDLDNHKKAHDFPALSVGGGGGKSGAHHWSGNMQRK